MHCYGIFGWVPVLGTGMHYRTVTKVPNTYRRVKMTFLFGYIWVQIGYAADTVCPPPPLSSLSPIVPTAYFSFVFVADCPQHLLLLLRSHRYCSLFYFSFLPSFSFGFPPPAPMWMLSEKWKLKVWLFTLLLFVFIPSTHLSTCSISSLSL